MSAQLRPSLGSGVSLGSAFRNKKFQLSWNYRGNKAWAANPWRTALPLSSINAEHQNLLSEVRAALFLSLNPAPRLFGTAKLWGYPVLRVPHGQQVPPEDAFTGATAVPEGTISCLWTATLPTGNGTGWHGGALWGHWLWRRLSEVLYLSGTGKFLLGHPCIFAG